MKKIVLLIAMTLITSGAYAGMNRDQIVKYFQGPDEPTAKDAVWTARDTFKVGVINNGSDRSGYANYVCSVLSENGHRGVWVQIIDIQKLTYQNKWVKLGEARCR